MLERLERLERLLRIAPNGDSVICLYDDRIATTIPGRMACVRASDVEFDPTEQHWAITYKEDGTKIPGFKLRRDAIQREIKDLEKLLEVNPEAVNAFITQETAKIYQKKLEVQK